eukprot:TRINITY_DN28389_c0_g1_i1.p1 TRINITY_DN28389_c0_g1~~TRINITY_DN28389_c0_g1_i1.p1  ORF type:complete len:622 (+),score=124.83 TRINITY_DN28389_c0_g1_i1:1-1866(+)
MRLHRMASTLSRSAACFLLAVPRRCEAALGVEVSMLGSGVFVAPSIGRLRQADTCSSLTGRFCPGLWAESEPSNEALLSRFSLESDEQDDELLDEPRLDFIPTLVESGLLDEEPRVQHRRLAHMSASLDLSAVPPWVDFVPDSFSSGVSQLGVSISWEGQWRPTALLRGSEGPRTVLELTGIGHIRFSRRVVVVDLMLRAADGPLLVAAYLAGAVAWRCRVEPGGAWQAAATGLWAADDITIVSAATSGAVLGALRVSATAAVVGADGVVDAEAGAQSIDVDPDFRNTLSATLLVHTESAQSGLPSFFVKGLAEDSVGRGSHGLMDLDGGSMFPVRVLVSPASIAPTLHDYYSGIPKSPASTLEERAAPPQVLPNKPPDLEDLMSMLTAVQVGMSLPPGLNRQQVERETERFHGVLSSHSGTGVKEFLKDAWNKNRFHVLEACLLWWRAISDGTIARLTGDKVTPTFGEEVQMAAPQQGDDAIVEHREDDNIDDVSSLMRSILGPELGSIIGNIALRMARSGDGGHFAKGLEGLMEVMPDGEDGLRDASDVAFTSATEKQGVGKTLEGDGEKQNDMNEKEEVLAELRFKEKMLVDLVEKKRRLESELERLENRQAEGNLGL